MSWDIDGIISYGALRLETDGGTIRFVMEDYDTARECSVLVPRSDIRTLINWLEQHEVE